MKQTRWIPHTAYSIQYRAHKSNTLIFHKIFMVSKSSEIDMHLCWKFQFLIFQFLERQKIPNQIDSIKYLSNALNCRTTLSIEILSSSQLPITNFYSENLKCRTDGKNGKKVSITSRRQNLFLFLNNSQQLSGVQFT